MKSSCQPLIDNKQLILIENVHRGFLYQHLYTVAWLISAKKMGVQSIVVERDEDLEIEFHDHKQYLQIKTRATSLKFSDIESALRRFNSLRIEHNEGRRQGSVAFAIVANVPPGPALLSKLQNENWPEDVSIYWPDVPEPTYKEIIEPWPNTIKAFEECTNLASSLPYCMLDPETLVWKLAGCVLAAAAGTPPRSDHIFLISELPKLFEQVVIQLQDFPTPPLVYRMHDDEPTFQSPEHVRIITGYSGSGKTSWASQAAIHSFSHLIYFDLSETPGPAITSSLARELAARLYGRSKGQLGEILLPGANGSEILHIIETRLESDGQYVTIVLDNAHRPPPSDIKNLMQHVSRIKFILLCQPGKNVHELEARLSITSEPLKGWGIDTIALEVANRNCSADFIECGRLATLTGGMPLYVQNAISIAGSEYNGSIKSLCDDIENKTHVVETAQELILSHVFEELSTENRNGISVLSCSDIPLARTDANELLKSVLKLNDRQATHILRDLRSVGCLELFGGDRVKIHDAMRLIGLSHNGSVDDLKSAQLVLKGILLKSLINNGPDLSALSLLLRTLVSLGEYKTIIEFATDELFHELGFLHEIMAFLETISLSDNIDPKDQFWAFDGLIFADLKSGQLDKASERLKSMERLLIKNNFSDSEKLTFYMKRMSLLSVQHNVEGVISSINDIEKILPSNREHQRIFIYNSAQALYGLGEYSIAIDMAAELIKEYYGELGLDPEDVVGRNPDKIWPLLKKEEGSLIDNLKHLADSLDLHATAMNKVGKFSPFGRIHAMKFYNLANAYDSLFRVGQDLVDEFVSRNDFIGAREIFENILLPYVKILKLQGKIIQLRSHYAVILAYCGDFDAAESEMIRLSPYESGLDDQHKNEIIAQREIIANLKLNGPAKQWTTNNPLVYPRKKKKIGRNETCPCGSGKKYKKCHGLKIEC